MAYTTIDDLRGALNPGAVQDRATASDLTDAELEDAITEAQSEVDAKIGARYAVPYADGNVPGVVARLTRDVAAYGATLTHRRFQPLDADHPVRLRYDAAQRLLDQIAAGKATIVAADVAATGEAVVQNVNEDDMFAMSDFDLASTWPYTPPSPSPYW